MSANTKLLTESMQRSGIMLTDKQTAIVDQLASAIFESAEIIENGPETSTTQNDELRDKSISSGTMRTEDLFPRFVAVLRQYNPEEAKQYDGIDPASIPDPEVADLMDRLFNSMDTIAPEGCYFGAHEGDGADFGFWSAGDNTMVESAGTANAQQTVEFTFHKNILYHLLTTLNYIGATPLMDTLAEDRPGMTLKLKVVVPNARAEQVIRDDILDAEKKERRAIGINSMSDDMDINNAKAGKTPATDSDTQPLPSRDADAWYNEGMRDGVKSADALYAYRASMKPSDHIAGFQEAVGMPTASTADLKDRSISTGTLRAEDIFPRLVNVLKIYDPQRAAQYDNVDISQLDTEKLDDMMDNLFNDMDAIAPEGCTFGSHPGDGADLGFWSAEE